MTYTYSQITEILGSYVEPDGDFKASLNQVLARIYNTGTYKDLVVQYSLPVVNQSVALPDEADAVLHTMVDGYPRPVRSMWHDFKTAGINSTDVTWGLVDSGYSPVSQLVQEEDMISILYLVQSTDDPESTAIEPDTGETVTVRARVAGQVEEVTCPDNTGVLTFSDDIEEVISIRFSGLARRYDLRTDASDVDTTIATVGPDSGVTRYRLFRLNRSVDGRTIVHVMCKRAFTPIVRGSDIIHVSNIPALKQGLLGRIAEDNADVERANYHWQQCTLLMEEQANSARGAALPRLTIDPFGTGTRNPILTSL
jgi:hypothetical protein